MQVISLPTSSRLVAEQGDLVQWFDKNFPGVRVDAIEADTPADLEAALRNRLEAEDRFGQRQKPFYLLWPTLYPIITQKFGANPQIYTRFGMPGHEGLDIRALPNTEVTCCAAGTVYRVHNNPDSHAYGIHVRVRHSNGYRTVYGHLAQALVAEGEVLDAGQVLGRADSTGASTASHLHLTLKQDGATARKETKYPKDVIDPTPFMVWPESGGKGRASADWPAERCLVGFHTTVSNPLSSSEIDWIKRANPEALKLSIAEAATTIGTLKEAKPDLFFVTRLQAELSAQPVSAEAFVRTNQEQLERHYQAGIRHFEVGTAPNLQNEGWNRSWKSGEEYGDWFETVSRMVRQRAPEAKIGFPGLSPGGSLSGWRQDEWTFLEGAESAMAQADWIGVICHWLEEAEMNSLDGGRRYLLYQGRFPSKLLMISEFNMPLTELSPHLRLANYGQYFHLLRGEANLAAAFAYPLVASQAFHELAVLKGEGEEEADPALLADLQL
jgi:hypothetical protein